LPRRQAVRRQTLEPRPQGPSIATLLVIESNQHTRKELVGALMDVGYEVEAVSSLPQARGVRDLKSYDGVVLDLEREAGDISGFLQLLRGDGGDDGVPIIGVGAAPPAQQSAFAELLAKPATPADILAALARAGSPAPRGRPVLVVDDDAGSLKLMEATLSNLGYEAACFTDAQDALVALQRLRPAAVVIDIIMPDMDGMAFLKRFRAADGSRRTPVMFWTVKDLSADERQDLQSAVDLIVQKGIGDGSRLSAALQAFLPPRGPREGVDD